MLLFYDFYNVANAESFCKFSILKSLVTGTIYFLLHAAGTLKFQYIFFVQVKQFTNKGRLHQAYLK